MIFTNKFTSLRTSVLSLFVLLNMPGFLHGQAIEYLPPFDLEARNEDKVQVIGKMGNQYYLYHYSPARLPELLVVNEAGQLVQTKPLDFIQPGLASSVNILLRESSMNVIVQELKANKHYVKIETLNQEGKVIKEPTYVDSTDYNQYGNFAYYRLLSSTDKKYSLLYRIVTGFSSIQALFNGILLNEFGEKISSSFFYLPFNSDMETIGNIFLTNQGKMILPVHDKHDNYKLGTTLKLYYSSLKNLPPVMFDFYLKENKPVELLLDWDDSRNRLAFGGLYYNFYTKNIEGAMTLFVNIEKQRLDTALYISIDKSFKKQLKHRIFNIPSRDVINSLRIRYFDVKESGAVTLLSDLFTNAAMYGKMAINIPPNPDLPSANRQAYFRPVPNSTSGNTLQERDFSNYFNSSSSNLAVAPGSQRVFNDRTNLGTNNSNSGTGTRTSGATVANGRPNMERNFSRNQNSYLNNSNSGSKTGTLYDAGNLAASNKSLNYKSVLFTLDTSLSTSNKTWAQQFFVPGTFFSNILIMPAQEGLGLLSYELNAKNNPVLTKYKFDLSGTVVQEAVGKPTDPLLFYKGNSVLYENDKILSLYVDPNSNKLGLAIVR